MQQLFITGLYRSGTTLLEKLLHNHPQVGIASQPFPNFFFHAKRNFFKKKQIERPLPLGHLFLEKDYELSEFHHFLNNYKLTQQDVDAFFSNVANANNNLVVEILAHKKEVKPDLFKNVYNNLLHLIASILKKETIYTGVKEILCEEYIPYFLRNGQKCVLIIRDPRDVITSLNFGKGNNYGGSPRPVLFSLRNWRKSVAFAVAFEKHPNFAWFRYEDLVTDTQGQLAKISHFLNVSPYPEHFLESGLKDQKGNTWGGNSSFGTYSGISSQSLHKFKQKLPEATIRYIETVCRPELQYMDDEFMFEKSANSAAIINDFEEPVATHRKYIADDYSTCPAHKKQEIERLQWLGEHISEDKQKQGFLFPEVYRAFSRDLRF